MAGYLRGNWKWLEKLDNEVLQMHEVLFVFLGFLLCNASLAWLWLFQLLHRSELNLKLVVFIFECCNSLLKLLMAHVVWSSIFRGGMLNTWSVDGVKVGTSSHVTACTHESLSNLTHSCKAKVFHFFDLLLQSFILRFKLIIYLELLKILIL